MAFFGLFKTRAERDSELKTRVRQGTLRIRKFVSQLTRQGEEYAVLARRASELDDQSQFRKLGCGYLKCRETINRWERYLVSLRALELQKNEAEATREFLASMNALTSAILTGVRPEDVAHMTAEMEQAQDRSEQLEDALAGALEDVVTRIDAGVCDESFLRQSLSLQIPNRNDGETTTVRSKSEADLFWTAIEDLKKEVVSG